MADRLTFYESPDLLLDSERAEGLAECLKGFTDLLHLLLKDDSSSSSGRRDRGEAGVAQSGFDLGRLGNWEHEGGRGTRECVRKFKMMG